jgi:protein-L-isoaspartate(D-aspartate) O-methyltransferase
MIGLEAVRSFMSVEFFEEQRRQMVAAIRVIADHIGAEISKSALDSRVLQALAKVPRHEFVPVEVRQYAYLNRPLPIGFDKTISQLLMVAVITDLLELKPNDAVLEIGTGLGYQAAVLAELSDKVYSVEIIDELAQRAVQRGDEAVANELAPFLKVRRAAKVDMVVLDRLPGDEQPVADVYK